MPLVLFIVLPILFPFPPRAMASDGAQAPAYLDLGPHRASGSESSEIWTYMFRFNNGTQAVLSLTKINKGSDQCIGVLSLIGFQGGNHTVVSAYPASNLKYDAGRQKLSIHENIWFHGPMPSRHAVHYFREKDGKRYLLDLRFKDILPESPNNRALGDLPKRGKIGLYLHIPHARVEGRIAVNDDTLQVTGLGYMDHQFQSHNPTIIFEYGYRFLSRDRSGWSGMALKTSKTFGSRHLGLMAKGSSDGPVSAQIQGLSFHERAKNGFPKSVTLKQEHADHPPLVLRHETYRQKWRSLSDQGKAGKVLAYWNGELVFFTGDGGPAEPAAFNLFVVD